jgi:uncharacterized membrane protein
MTWSRWYAIKSYLLSTVWIAPVTALILEQATFRLALVIDVEFGWIPGFAFDRDGTVTIADYIINSSVAFIVFTFSSLLVAIQVASGQLTPRIIATTLLRNLTIRRLVALFVYSLLLAVAVKSRVDVMPRYLVSFMAILGILNVIGFMFLIDYAARLLRPVSIMWRIAERGLKVIEDVYPQLLVDRPPSGSNVEKLGLPDLIINHRGRSAIVIALNLDSLVSVARRADCVIEFVPRVGDFVGVGEPLFLLRGPRANEINDRTLRGLVAFGPERTIEQDSTFAFRVIVDIALKALSPAINDPTTAVLAIDQLQRLLRTVGHRNLHDERILDHEGRLRLILRTPNWTDFVQITLTELRHYGAENIQVVRRLRAMIESVLFGLPESRVSALRQELALLDSVLERIHLTPEDLAIARVPDSQGLGGASA